MSSEYPEPLYQIKTHTGESYGPASRSEIEAWAADGRIAQDDIITLDGGEPQLASNVDWICAAWSSRTPPRHQSEVDQSVNKPNSLQHIVPTRNAPALAAWYLGVFGLIPGLGLPLAIAAIVMGILGIRRASQVKVGLWHGILGLLLGTTVATISTIVVLVTLTNL